MNTTSDSYPEPEAEKRFNPFPGLRPFKPGEEHLFFGREKQIDELLERLDRRRFLSIIGTSGSGISTENARSPCVRGDVPVSSVRLAGIQTGHSVYARLNSAPQRAN